jgi:hypothetical protein
MGRASMSYRHEFVVESGSKIRLAKIDPSYTGKHNSHDKARPEIARQVERMDRLQYLLYADAGQSLLIVLQALDAGGKDGVIRHLFTGMNPQGTIGRGLQAAEQNGAGPRLPVARSSAGAGLRRGRDLQPLSLRGRSGGARTQRRTLPGVVEALRYYQRFRADAGGKRHAHPQILPSHRPGRTARALQVAARRRDAPVEDQRQRLRGARVLAAIRRGLRGSARMHQHQMGAVVRDPRQPQMVSRPLRLGDRRRYDGRDGAQDDAMPDLGAKVRRMRSAG